MRLIPSACLLLALLFAGSDSGLAQAPNGGITASGWSGKVDLTKEATTINSTSFAAEGTGYRVITGPAALYWRSEDSIAGEFTVKATFDEQRQKYRHPHAFGVFIGGAQLNTAAPTVLYCVAYRDGAFLVRQLKSGKATTVVQKTPHDAIANAGSPLNAITQEIGWNVRNGRAECVINGVAVWGTDQANLIGPGKLDSLDGIVGIRVTHDVDVLVTNFTVGP